MRTRALFIALLVLVLAVVSSSSVHAASIPVLDSSFHIVPSAHDIDPLCAEGAPLSMGAVMEIIQRFVNAGISFAILIFVIIFAWAGFLFISSVANPESKNLAKKMLMNAAVGLLIVLAAWLIVDFVMKTLYNPNGSGFGPWNSILGSGPACIIERPTAALFSGAITAADLSVSVPGGGSGFGSSDGFFTYQSGIEAQKRNLSPAMANALACMASNVPRGVGQISSISDTAIMNGKTFAQCAKGGCAHTANSCHYGGRTCIGASYAVDFGDEQNATVLKAAAAACGAKTLNEGNHLHVSIGDASGCGCSL